MESNLIQETELKFKFQDKVESNLVQETTHCVSSSETQSQDFLRFKYLFGCTWLLVYSFICVLHETTLYFIIKIENLKT